MNSNSQAALKSESAFTEPTSETKARPTPRAVIISAWAVPVMVAGQFAMLAIIPLGIAVAGILRNRELHALRGWVFAVAGAYGAALLLWAIGPDRAPSLSKELHPAHAAVITVLGVALAVAFHLRRRKRTA